MALRCSARTVLCTNVAVHGCVQQSTCVQKMVCAELCVRVVVRAVWTCAHTQYLTFSKIVLQADHDFPKLCIWNCAQVCAMVCAHVCRVVCVRVTVRAGVKFSECASADSSAISGWSVQGFIQVLFFRVRFYFSNVWLDVHGFNTNLKEMRMGFIKPGPKILRWIHVRQR